MSMRGRHAQLILKYLQGSALLVTRRESGFQDIQLDLNKTLANKSEMGVEPGGRFGVREGLNKSVNFGWDAPQEFEFTGISVPWGRGSGLRKGFVGTCPERGGVRKG